MRHRLTLAVYWLIRSALSPAATAAGPPNAAVPPDPVARQEPLSEINIKMARVQDFLRAQGLAGILFTRINNFTWMTAGLADND